MDSRVYWWSYLYYYFNNINSWEYPSYWKFLGKCPFYSSPNCAMAILKVNLSRSILKVALDPRNHFIYDLLSTVDLRQMQRCETLKMQCYT